MGQGVLIELEVQSASPRQIRMITITRRFLGSHGNNSGFSDYGITLVNYAYRMYLRSALPSAPPIMCTCLVYVCILWRKTYLLQSRSCQLFSYKERPLNVWDEGRDETRSNCMSLMRDVWVDKSAMCCWLSWSVGIITTVLPRDRASADEDRRHDFTSGQNLRWTLGVLNCFRQKE